MTPASSVPSSASALPSETLDFANKMFDLARTGSPLLMEYIRSGLPLNLTNNRGDTLLMLATYHGHAALAKALLEAGSDANQLNGKEQSCLAGAVFKGHEEVIHLLVSHGADPSAGQPSAVETAQMFNKTSLLDVFREAPGLGRGSRLAAAEVEDREEVRRVPGVGVVRSAGETDGNAEAGAGGNNTA